MVMETKEVKVFSISVPQDTFYGRQYDVEFEDAEGQRYSATIKNSNRIMKDLNEGDSITIKFNVKDDQMFPQLFTEINYVTKEN